MLNRNYIRLLSVAVAFAAVGFSAAVQASEKPNIVFFIVDDYDKEECSVYGGKVLTPNLERMAKNGITFNNAYMSSTVCTPSRYTCLTGRNPSSCYYSRFLEEFPAGHQSLPGFNVGLEPDNMNVAQVLADNGYVTGMVGKFHVGLGGGHSSERESLKGAPLTDELNKKKYELEKQIREKIKEKGFTWAKNIYKGNTKSPYNLHNPEWTISAALEFVDEFHDKPFFLYYGTTLLHGGAGGWYKSLMTGELTSDEGMLEKPIGIMDRKSVITRLEAAGLNPKENAGFLWMDDTLGMLLDKLEEHGIADNTLVCFVADHGSGGKGSIYRTNATEVPCLMTWPARMLKGVRTDELIQGTDFVATWFDVAGATVPKEYKIDGVSVAPLFTEPDQAVRDYAYSEIGVSRSIKTKEWNYMSARFTKEQLNEWHDRKLMRKSTGLSGGLNHVNDHPAAYSADQLYNLSKDPTELNNLAESPEYAGKIKEMQAMLIKEIQSQGRAYGELVPGPNTTTAAEGESALQKLRDDYAIIKKALVAGVKKPRKKLRKNYAAIKKALAAGEKKPWKKKK